MRELTRDERALIFLDSFENVEYKHKKALLDLAKSPCGLFENKYIIIKSSTQRIACIFA